MAGRKVSGFVQGSTIPSDPSAFHISVFPDTRKPAMGR